MGALSLVLALLVPLLLVPAPAAGQRTLDGVLRGAVSSALEVNITESTTPGNANYNQNLTAHATGGVPPYSYLWNGGWTDPGPIRAMLLWAGNFTYMVVVTDSVGSTAAAYDHLMVPPPGGLPGTFDLTASVLRYTPTAAGAIVAFSSVYSGNQAPVQTFAWYFGDGGTSHAQNPTHQFNGSGDYEVSATATTNGNDPWGGGDSASFALDVVVQVGGVITLTAAEYQHSSSILNNSQVAELYTMEGAAVGGSPPYRYQWNFGDGSQSPVQPNATVNHTFVADVADGSKTYLPTLKVTDATGAAWSSVLEVSVSPASHIGGGFPLEVKTPPPYPLIDLLFVGAGITIAVGAVVVVVMRRRGAKRGPVGGKDQGSRGSTEEPQVREVSPAHSPSAAGSDSNALGPDRGSSQGPGAAPSPPR